MFSFRTISRKAFAGLFSYCCSFWGRGCNLRPNMCLLGVADSDPCVFLSRSWVIEPWRSWRCRRTTQHRDTHPTENVKAKTTRRTRGTVGTGTTTTGTSTAATAGRPTPRTTRRTPQTTTGPVAAADTAPTRERGTLTTEVSAQYAAHLVQCGQTRLTVGLPVAYILIAEGVCR